MHEDPTLNGPLEIPWQTVIFSRFPSITIFYTHLSPSSPRAPHNMTTKRTSIPSSLETSMTGSGTVSRDTLTMQTWRVMSSVRRSQLASRIKARYEVVCRMIMQSLANHQNAISLPYLICRQLCDRAIHNPYKYIRTHVPKVPTYATVAASDCGCGCGCDLDRAERNASRLCRYR
jgi:hypothetical protein